VTVTVAVSVAEVEGVNVTVNVQTTVAGTVGPHVLKLVKSAAFGPLTTIPVMSTGFVPATSDTVCGWLCVPVLIDPKFKAVGNICGPVGDGVKIFATNAFGLAGFLRDGWKGLTVGKSTVLVCPAM